MPSPRQTTNQRAPITSALPQSLVPAGECASTRFLASVEDEQTVGRGAGKFIYGSDGMERETAWQLIDELAAHTTQGRFIYYHSWRVGDLLIWDERATMHPGAGDSNPAERRVMLRTIVYPN
jgi:hypothetical protein